MRWVGLALVGLALLATACGGRASDEGAPDESAATDPGQEGALEANLETALLRDLPLLVEEEASCISDAILAALPDSDTALEDIDIEVIADEILAGAHAAQERCLTPDRIAELEQDEAAIRTRGPEEEAYLLAVRDAVGGLDGEDQELVEAGYLVCGLAEGAGSLDTLLALLAATPESSAEVAAGLLPLLGRVLELQELMIFSTMGVATLCPEFDDA